MFIDESKEYTHPQTRGRFTLILRYELFSLLKTLLLTGLKNSNKSAVTFFILCLSVMLNGWIEAF
jgi:hypothetical protein